jgi:hypothetical protein
MRKFFLALLLVVCSGLPAFAARAYTEPYLVSLTPSTEMNVCWLLAEAGDEAWVEFGETEELGRREEARLYEVKGLRTSAKADGYDPEPEKNPELKVFQRIATLRGLKPGTEYRYRTVVAEGGKTTEGPVYSFRTAPVAGGSPFTFILLSDLQQKKQIVETVNMAGRQNADFILYAGDFQNTPWKAAEWFPVEGSFIAPEEKGREWFPPCSRRRTERSCSSTYLSSLVRATTRRTTSASGPTSNLPRIRRRRRSPSTCSFFARSIRTRSTDRAERTGTPRITAISTSSLCPSSAGTPGAVLKRPAGSSSTISLLRAAGPWLAGGGL